MVKPIPGVPTPPPQPRPLRMEDMLRSTQPNPALHDAMDEAKKPIEYPPLFEGPAWCQAYAKDKDVSLRAAKAEWEGRRAVEREQEERERLDNEREYWQQRLYEARTIDDLKPVLEQIINKLYGE